MTFRRTRFLIARDKVSSKVADSIQEGDIYNDGKYEGKVIEVGTDEITIESQNEDGDIVNIQIPIEDGNNYDVIDYDTGDITEAEILLADIEPVTGLIDTYEEDITNSGVVSIKLNRPLSDEDIEYIENKGYFVEFSTDPSWVDIYLPDEVINTNF